MALVFICVAAVVPIINNFRTANDRADHATNHCPRRAGNDRACPSSDCRTRNGAIARDDTLFRTRKGRSSGYAKDCHDSERELLHLFLSPTDAHGIGTV
jgi:hypothetical protein